MWRASSRGDGRTLEAKGLEQYVGGAVPTCLACHGDSTMNDNEGTIPQQIVHLHS